MRGHACMDAWSVQVQRASAADREAALAILLDAARRQRTFRPHSWGENDLRRTVDRGIDCGELYLGHVEGDAAGVFVLQWADPAIWGEQPDDAGYVHKLAVAQRAAGRGVGLALLCQAEEMVRAAGRLYLRLDSDAANPGLDRYYRDAGFTVQSAVTPANGLTVWLYQRRVRPAAPGATPA
jgi:ribosomal protein S18 acetylase RimI-like enzyme